MFIVVYFFGLLGGFCQQSLKDQTNTIPGFSVDIRFLDPLNLDKNSVISGTNNIIFQTEKKDTFLKLKTTLKPEINYEFINSAYEFEHQILKVNSVTRPFSSKFSGSYNAGTDAKRANEFLWVYCILKKPLYNLNLNNAPLTGAFKDAVNRLGRDLTPEGFISKFGTHYTDRITLGGNFISKNSLRRDNFIESPYTKNEFKEAVLKAIVRQKRGDSISDPYIQLAQAQFYTRGGAISELWEERWEQTLTDENAVVIDADFIAITNLLSTKNFPNLDDLQYKRSLLQEAIDTAVKKSISWQATAENSDFFKKYSLEFTQKIGKLIKKSVGTETHETSRYLGDLFFGSFNENGEPMETKAVIDYNGIDLNTLLTDEEIQINKRLDFTISPEELKKAYVSVWDDTKKLVKGGGRTTMYLSGKAEARTYFKEALIKPVYKEVEITTIDKDVFKITYSLERVQNKNKVLALSKGYDYSLDSEVVASAAAGDTANLEKFYFEGASRNTAGVVKALIQNFDDATMLNLVFDFGVKPTTEDLDLAFDPEYFSKEKVICLLERGAKPKNNMIYKAVAYKEPDVVYALLREHAIPVNNDIAFAAKLKNYEVIKALMSLDFKGFLAEEDMLAIAVENKDTQLTEKFISRGAVANPAILKSAIDTNNQELLNLVKTVSKNSSEVFEVIATANNTELFNYFINKGNVEISDSVLSTAIANDNLIILGLALDAGGSADYSMQKALELKNVNAIRLSLKKGANADSVFNYAASENNFELYKEALNTYNGNPQIALTTAVTFDALDFAHYTFTKKEAFLNADLQMLQAVKNKNQEMLDLLISYGGKPQTALEEAVNLGNIDLTRYLISKGASVTNAELIQKAVALDNAQLSALLLATEDVNPNDVLLDILKLKNEELLNILINQGAVVTEDAIDEAIRLENEANVLQLFGAADQFILTENLLFHIIKKEMNVAADFLIERLDKADLALDAAFQFKNKSALILALQRGATVTDEDLIKAVENHFEEAIPILLKQNLNASVVDSEGNTLLHFITNQYNGGDEDLMDILFDAGVNINAKNKEGETPLHWAVKAGIKNKVLIEKLIQHGALPEAKTISNKSVSDYADSKQTRQFLRRLEVH